MLSQRAFLAAPGREGCSRHTAFGENPAGAREAGRDPGPPITSIAPARERRSPCVPPLPPPRHSLLQEFLQAAELEHEILDVDGVQLVVRVAQRLVDQQVHGG